MMFDRRHRERHGSRVAVLASVMLLNMGFPRPDVFAQGGTGWVDPPLLESPTGQPAPQPNPEIGAPAAPRTLTPRVTEPSPALAPEAAAPRISRPRVVEAPAEPELTRRRISRPRVIAPPALEPEPTRRRASRPRVVEPRLVFEPEPTRPRTRPRLVEPPPLKPEPTRLPRLTRPKPQQEPEPALRRARVPIEEIEEVVEVAPAPRLARKHAVGPIPRPSFNCRYAKTAVERAICADPVLAAKDRRMALLYEQAGGSRYRPVDPSQWSWLAARNRCGSARGPALEGCLHAAYNDRMAELSAE